MCLVEAGAGESQTSKSQSMHSFVNLPSFTPPVRVTVGEVRYSIEIDVGGE